MKYTYVTLFTILSFLGYAASTHAAYHYQHRPLVISSNQYQPYGYQRHNYIPITVPEALSKYWRDRLNGQSIDLSMQEHLSKTTLQELKEMHPEEPLIVALVPYNDFDGWGGARNTFRVYEAHRFNRNLVTFPSGVEIQGPQYEAIRDWNYEVCYFILNPGTSSFIFFASFSDLLESTGKRKTLQKYNHEDFNYESFTDLSNGHVESFDGQPQEHGVHRKLPLTYYAKLIAFTAGSSFLHGLVNNWLGRRAHENNTWFLKAPAREWGTAALDYLTWNALDLRKISAEGNRDRFIWCNALIASAAQMLGEIIPLPGHPGRRSLAINTKFILPFLYQFLFVPHS